MITLVTLVGVVIYGRTVRSPSDPVPVRFVEVERRTIEVTINESGTVELGNQQTLTSPAEGAVEEVLVSPGDRVTAGQILITLRNPERQTALTAQRLEIEQQEETLRRNRQRVTEAREQLTADERELRNLEGLATEGAIAQREVQDQARQVRQSQAALRDAVSEVQQAELALAQLKLEQQRIERELRDTIITAPMDGVILGVDVKDGDGVEIRTELLTIGDASQEFVRLELSTLNASQVMANQQARISVIGPDSQIFTGTVMGLYPQAVPSSGESSGNGGESGQARVPTLIRLDQPTQTLIPGGPVNVEIILEQRQNVVALEVEALQQDADQPFVWMMREGSYADQQPVETGLESLTQVEITAGLEAGERIILPPLDIPLEAGMSVVEAEDLPPAPDLPPPS